MTPTLLEQIEKWNEDFILALRRGDQELVSALFSERAVIVPPGLKPINTVQTLKAYLKELSQWTLEMKTQDVMPISGTVVREVGTLKLTKRIASVVATKPAPSPAQVPILCQYLGLFEKVDEAWRRNSLIWNRAPARLKTGPLAGRQAPGDASRAVYVPRID